MLLRPKPQLNNSPVICVTLYSVCLCADMITVLLDFSIEHQGTQCECQCSCLPAQERIIYCYEHCSGGLQDMCSKQ